VPRSPGTGGAEGPEPPPGGSAPDAASGPTEQHPGPPG
jgi:hypothetical protein